MRDAPRTPTPEDDMSRRSFGKEKEKKGIGGGGWRGSQELAGGAG
jgi:hypothetical protein